MKHYPNLAPRFAASCLATVVGTDLYPPTSHFFTCANCGASLREHCHVHAIPCCPGKCSGPAPTWFCTCGHPEGDHARLLEGTDNPADDRETWPCDVRGCRCPMYTVEVYDG